MTSSGRPFQILGHAAVANERSATVARRDGRTSSRLEVDDRRRPLDDIAQFFREIVRYCAVQSSIDDDHQQKNLAAAEGASMRAKWSTYVPTSITQHTSCYSNGSDSVHRLRTDICTWAACVCCLVQRGRLQ